MKQVVFIICVLLSLPSMAQKEKVNKLRIQHGSIQQFISASGVLHKVSFTLDYAHRLKIKPDTVLPVLQPLVYENWFSVNYSGHNYLLEKYYSRFPKLELLTLLDSLLAKECQNPLTTGTIYADHIDIEITSHCPGKRGENEYYVISGLQDPSFMGGPAALTQLISAKLACAKDLPTVIGDSAIFLKVLIKKDSVVYEAALLEPKQSTLANPLIKALLHTTGWKPYEHDGRFMHSYWQVFVRFRKDGTIEADYLH